MTVEEIRSALTAALEWKRTNLKLKFSNPDYEQSYVEITFSDPLTFAVLRTVAKFFGSEDIDVEGNHGDGSYDTGMEVELFVRNPRVMPS